MISVEYNLQADGWASLTFRQDGREGRIGLFGRNSDALGDLLRATLHVATGGPEATVLFDGEPEAWRLRLAQTIPPSGRMQFSITYSEAGFDRRSPEGGAISFELETPLDDFVAAVISAAREAWTSFGPKGYAVAWGGFEGFPLRALVALEAALTVQDPPGRDREP